MEQSKEQELEWDKYMKPKHAHTRVGKEFQATLPSLPKKQQQEEIEQQSDSSDSEKMKQSFLLPSKDDRHTRVGSEFQAVLPGQQQEKKRKGEELGDGEGYKKQKTWSGLKLLLKGHERDFLKPRVTFEHTLPLHLVVVVQEL